MIMRMTRQLRIRIWMMRVILVRRSVVDTKGKRKKYEIVDD